jgi:hypothetical protein
MIDSAPVAILGLLRWVTLKLSFRGDTMYAEPLMSLVLNRCSPRKSGDSRRKYWRSSQHDAGVDAAPRDTMDFQMEEEKLSISHLPYRLGLLEF